MTGLTGRQQEAPDHKKTACKRLLDSDFIPDSRVESPFETQMLIFASSLRLFPTVLSVRLTQTDPAGWDCWLKAGGFCTFWPTSHKSGRVYITADQFYFNMLRNFYLQIETCLKWISLLFFFILSFSSRGNVVASKGLIIGAFKEDWKSQISEYIAQ